MTKCIAIGAALAALFFSPWTIRVGKAQSPEAEITLHCQGTSAIKEFHFGGVLGSSTENRVDVYDKFLRIDLSNRWITDESGRIVTFNCSISQTEISCDTGTQSTKQGEYLYDWSYEIDVNRLSGRLSGKRTSGVAGTEAVANVWVANDTAVCQRAEMKKLF